MSPSPQTVSSPPWGGRIFLGPGLIMYLGRGGEADEHAHHTIQVVVSFDRPVHLDVEGRRLSARSAIVPQNARHALDGRGAELALLLVEPLGARGTVLERRARELVGEELASITGSVSVPADSPTRAQAAAWCDRILDALRCPALPAQAVHRAVRRSLSYVERNVGGSPALAEAAAEAGLSASRLTHLFTEQVGLPFRRYVLWLRIRAAAQQALRGGSLTEAAHAAGFADQAHLSRTFRRMFGLSPSAVLPRAELQDG